ncbi:phage tail protein I [Roseospira visakhapatnamensis]|uniref:Phage tail P2-like protein n=1 Tax=Roseospira visakhapatnamensis TaxID=390880 RepID=A0A7W6RFJ4_9PROT|nr:phage tail protein I [Roseospira visakhapatnamensis]MBB4267357.1 phage tail P2-like protein [Roseospira visakhapatnamensis]
MSDPSSLLPPNATPLERALDGASARVGDIPVGVVRTLWNPWTCPADRLPWLAWACSVDVWDDAWPEATRRRVIADSYAVHSVKGTVGAVRWALASLGYTTRLIEWQQEDGAPFTFRVEVDVLGRPVTEATYAEIERTALAAKNVRSHLTGIRAVGRVDGTVTLGAATLGGDTLTVLPWTPSTLTAQAPAHVGAAAWLVDGLTVWPREV